MTKFIEVKTKIGAMLVNLDTVDCISNNEAENHAVLSFAGSEETLNIAESYESIAARIRGMMYFGEKTESEKIEYGKWIKTYPDEPLDGRYYCSKCNKDVDITTGEETPIDRDFFYCPNCGAKMNLGDDEE